MDEQKMFREIHKLTKENNRMLRAMRRDAFIGMIFKIIFWAVMLGIPIWLYLTVLKPQIEAVTNSINNISDTASNVGELRDNVVGIPIIHDITKLFGQ